MSNPFDDPMSPYYIHHSHTPGISLVTQLLTGENYASWNRAATIALSAKNKLGFVDGTLLQPEIGDQVLTSSWNRNNSIVMSWLLSSVSKEIAASLLYHNTAYAIWHDLKERFKQTNGPKIFQLQLELLRTRQDQSTVNTYFTRLKTVWEELNNFRPVCTCGGCKCGGFKELDLHHQTEYLIIFLMGLNDSFAHTRGQILLMDPLPSLSRAFALVSQEECQRGIKQPEDNGVRLSESAFAIRTDGKKSGTDHNFRKKPRPQCTYCNLLGHTRDKCYKLHGYPPGYKSKPKFQKSDDIAVNSVQICEPPSFSNRAQDFFRSLDKEQSENLLSMLTGQIHQGSTSGTQSGEPFTGVGKSEVEKKKRTTVKIKIIERKIKGELHSGF